MRRVWEAFWIWELIVSWWLPEMNIWTVLSNWWWSLRTQWSRELAEIDWNNRILLMFSCHVRSWVKHFTSRHKHNLFTANQWCWLAAWWVSAAVEAKRALRWWTLSTLSMRNCGDTFSAGSMLCPACTETNDLGPSGSTADTQVKSVISWMLEYWNYRKRCCKR